MSEKSLINSDNSIFKTICTVPPQSLTVHQVSTSLDENCRRSYEGRSFNVVIGVLQGTLLIPFTLCLLQPFEVFSLDGNKLFKSRNPFCKGREVGLFRYTLKTLPSPLCDS